MLQVWITHVFFLCWWGNNAPQHCLKFPFHIKWWRPESISWCDMHTRQECFQWWVFFFQCCAGSAADLEYAHSTYQNKWGQNSWVVCLSECFKAKCIIIFTQREVWIAAGRRLADNTSLGRSKATPGVFVARRPSFETFILAKWGSDTHSAEHWWLKSESETYVLTVSSQRHCLTLGERRDKKRLLRAADSSVLWWTPSC